MMMLIGCVCYWQALEARPIPFAYVHLFNSIIYIYLFFVAYAGQFVEGNFTLRLLSFLILSFILISFSTLSASMAKPIGRGPMKIDVIAITLNRYRQAMEFLDENVRLPTQVEEAATMDDPHKAFKKIKNFLNAVHDKEVVNALNVGSGFAYSTVRIQARQEDRIRGETNGDDDLVEEAAIEEEPNRGATMLEIGTGKVLQRKIGTTATIHNTLSDKPVDDL
jgi:hypothetical protein